MERLRFLRAGCIGDFVLLAGATVVGEGFGGGERYLSELHNHSATKLVQDARFRLLLDPLTLVDNKKSGWGYV